MIFFIIAFVLSFWPWLIFWQTKFDKDFLMAVLWMQAASLVILFSAAAIVAAVIVPNCNWLMCK